MMFQKNVQKLSISNKLGGLLGHDVELLVRDQWLLVGCGFELWRQDLVRVTSHPLKMGHKGFGFYRVAQSFAIAKDRCSDGKKLFLFG